MFNWLFGIGDRVKDRDGKEYNVRGFEREGYVVVKEPGSNTETTRFGGSLSPAKAEGQTKGDG